MEELNFDTDDEYTAAPLESDSDDDDLMYETPAVQPKLTVAQARSYISANCKDGCL